MEDRLIWTEESAVDSGKYSTDLYQELKMLREDLQRQFRGMEWKQLSGTLESLARLGEVEGARELCLRAQSLRELMGYRAGGRGASGDRIDQLFDELMFHLSHLQWSTQTTH